MQIKSDEYVAIHRDPVWREEANYIFAVQIGEKEGKFEWEQLWGKKIEDKLLKVCCLPFFAFGIALGDSVRVDNDGFFSKVEDHSSLCNIRLWFGSVSEQDRLHIIGMINSMGVSEEWSSHNLLAIGIEKERFEVTLSSLREMQKAYGLLIEVGKGM